jgi:hypothetical protein
MLGSTARRRLRSAAAACSPLTVFNWRACRHTHAPALQLLKEVALLSLAARSRVACPPFVIFFFLRLSDMQAHARAGSAAFDGGSGFVFPARSLAACSPLAFSIMLMCVQVHALAVTGDFLSSQACTSQACAVSASQACVSQVCASQTCAVCCSCVNKYALARYIADSALLAPCV